MQHHLPSGKDEQKWQRPVAETCCVSKERVFKLKLILQMYFTKKLIQLLKKRQRLNCNRGYLSTMDVYGAALTLGFLLLFQKKWTASPLVSLSALIFFLLSCQTHELEFLVRFNTFCPDLCTKSATSKSLGVLMCHFTHLAKSPNAAVTTGFDWRCHLVDTIFAEHV